LIRISNIRVVALCGSERDDFRPKRRSRVLPRLTGPKIRIRESYRKMKFLVSKLEHSEQLVAFSAFRFGNSACVPMMDLEIGSKAHPFIHKAHVGRRSCQEALRSSRDR
jgi:hypothetical protein